MEGAEEGGGQWLWWWGEIYLNSAKDERCTENIHPLSGRDAQKGGEIAEEFIWECFSPLPQAPAPSSGTAEHCCLKPWGWPGRSSPPTKLGSMISFLCYSTELGWALGWVGAALQRSLLPPSPHKTHRCCIAGLNLS